MKKAAILIITLITGFFFNSCLLDSVKGDGNVAEETIETDNFNKLDVSHGMNVYINQGPETRVVLIADKNLHKHIDIWVDNEELNVTTTKLLRNAKMLKVQITVPDLEQIKTSSGSNVFADSTLKLGDLKLKATAGSNIRLTIEAANAEIAANAGSNIFLGGHANSVSVKTSSGANVKAADLTTENAEIRASSGANIWLEVNKTLKARVSSGANFFYTGEPSGTEIEKSSGGNVIKN